MAVLAIGGCIENGGCIIMVAVLVILAVINKGGCIDNCGCIDDGACIVIGPVLQLWLYCNRGCIRMLLYLVCGGCIDILWLY